MVLQFEPPVAGARGCGSLIHARTMQMAFSPSLGMGTAKRRRPEEFEIEESRCGRYRPAGLEALVSSVALTNLGMVRALTVRADGTVFVCTDSALYALAGAGQMTLIAGSRSETGFRDGLGAEARFNKPSGLAVYSDGSLVLADTYNHCLRRISPQGAVS